MTATLHQTPAEVQSAVSWWTRQIEGSGKLDGHTISSFESQLQTLLMDKVAGHWWPAEPRRGQGHRYLISLPSLEYFVKLEKIADTRSVSLQARPSAEESSLIHWHGPFRMFPQTSGTGAVSRVVLACIVY